MTDHFEIPGTGNLVDVYRLPNFSDLATPIAPIGISHHLEDNDCGHAQFSVPIDDPAADLIDINDVAAIRRNGTTVFPLLIEKIDHHTLDAEGGSREYVTYSGRSTAAFLEWMRIAPALGDRALPPEEDAVFDWRSWRYTRAVADGFVAATEIMSVADAEAGAWPHQPMADKFDLTTGAQMILSSSGDGDYAPLGWYLFYRDITIDVAGRYATEMLMDDHGLFWGDAIQQYEVRPEDGFVTASFKRLELSVGTHRFCWAVHNFEDPDNPGLGLGPAALAYNFYKADLQDRPLAGGLYLVSDSNTKVLYIGTGSAPGMTVGEDLTALIGEATDRGTAPWVSTNADGDDDSASEAWARELSITTKTGSSVLQFVDELVASRRLGRWRILMDGVTFEFYKPGHTNRPVFAPPYDSGYVLEPAPVLDARTGQLVQLDRQIT